MSDLIDRQQAIKEAESWVGLNGYEQHLQRDVVEWLKELPSAQPEPQSPCDLCVYNPPSSMDGKPCCMCVAEPWRGEEE